jgi:thiol-disulfide isomerase/thioredoxin
VVVRHIVFSVVLLALLWLPVVAQASWHESAPPFSGQMRDFSILKTPRAAPDYQFTGPNGEQLSLADFHGKVVLVNFWATWCPPCVEEMPSLDQLQANLGGPRFEVLALSLDRSRPIVKKFFEDFGLQHLAIYIDTKGKAMLAFAVGGLPTSIVVGPDGTLLGALAGPAKWDSELAEEFIRYFIDRAPG